MNIVRDDIRPACDRRRDRWTAPRVWLLGCLLALGSGCALGIVSRLGDWLPTGAWRRRVAHDGVVGLLAGLALLPALTYAGALAYARRGIAGDVIAAIITETACASIFLLARVGVRLWL